MGISLKTQVQEAAPLKLEAQAEPADGDLVANEFVIFPITVNDKTELAVKGKDSTGTVQPIAQITKNGGQISGDDNGNYITFVYTLSPTDATNKYFMLSPTPKTPSLLTAQIVDGPEQLNGIDFQVSGSSFEWIGLGLDPAVDPDGDGGLVSGDEILLTYFS